MARKVFWGNFLRFLNKPPLEIAGEFLTANTQPGTEKLLLPKPFPALVPSLYPIQEIHNPRLEPVLERVALPPPLFCPFTSQSQPNNYLQIVDAAASTICNRLRRKFENQKGFLSFSGYFCRLSMRPHQRFVFSFAARSVISRGFCAFLRSDFTNYRCARIRDLLAISQRI